MISVAANEPESSSPARKKPFYMSLSFQVLAGVALAVVLGYARPDTAVAMKPLGDAFIRLITMIITLVIFCTLVTGIAGMDDMKKVGRVGGKALLYFEVVSSLALLIGLLVGNLRTHYPLFGRIPDGAISLMTSLGLAAFVGLTGIHAGPVFVSALKEAGIGLLLGGAMVTLLPQIVGFCLGHFALRMNPILLLGALTGGQTVTAAMAAVQERSGSPVAVLGYTPAYPVANILLTTWGSIIVVVFGG